MKKMKKSDERYVHCPEFRVIRLEQHKSPYAGLYTEGISICGILCFQSKDGTRQSLVHANRFTQIETLIEEANWIGEGGRCIVYTKNKKSLNPLTGEAFIIGVDFISEMTEKSRCHFKVQELDQEVIALLQKSDGTVLFYKTIEHDLNIVYHPNFPQLECVYKLNENLAYGTLLELKQSALLFDGANWQTLKDHDLKLHPVAYKFLTLIDARPSDGFRSVLIKLRLFAEKFMKSKKNIFCINDTNFIVLATKPQAAISLVPFMQQYLLANDAGCQFYTNVYVELQSHQAETNSDHELQNLLRRALESSNPVIEVPAVFNKCQYTSDYRKTLHGIIMGFNGFLFHYQRAQLGKWIDVDTLEQTCTESSQPLP